MNLTDDQHNELIEHGDVLELTEVNGSVWRIRVETEPDNDHTLADDGDWYGKVAWINDRRDRTDRPDGYDGAARILHVGGDRYWWQPPDDIKSDPDLIDSMRTHLVDLINYGWIAVGVILEQYVHDALGGEHWVIADQQWIAGVEWDADKTYLKDITGDLISMLPDLDIRP